MSSSELTKQHADLSAKAYDAFYDEDYNEALILFNDLVNKEPENPEFLLRRCQVYKNLTNFTSSLDDANKALELLKQGSHSRLARAHVEAGVALYYLDRFTEAQKHFEESKILNPEAKIVSTWLGKNQEKLPKEEVAVPAAEKEEPVIAKVAPVPVTVPAQTAPKARYEWFQNSEYVTIEVFIKGTKKENVDLNFFEKSMSLTAKLPNGSDYSLELEPFTHPIVPKESRYTLLSTKIEIKLKKEMGGIMWGALEGEDTQTVFTNNVTTKPSATKDWNKIAKEVEKEEGEGEGEQALNSLFQNIYKDADPDTKRAMMKSYIESNGTCLSTNWSEIGSKQTEVKPPEGMIAKKY